jgi:hypothetical protein
VLARLPARLSKRAASRASDQSTTYAVTAMRRGARAHDARILACETPSQSVRESAPVSSSRWASLTVPVTVAADGARHVASRLLERVRGARVTV